MIIRVQHYRAARTELQFEVPVDDLRAYLADAGGIYRDVGAPARFEGWVERADDTLQVHGEVALSYRLTCSRCAIGKDDASAFPVRWTLLPVQSLNAQRLRPDEEIELSTDDLDVSFYSGDEIDLGELVREALILELDPDAVCGEEACDERLAVLVAKYTDAHVETVDPRWAALEAMKEKLKS